MTPACLWVTFAATALAHDLSICTLDIEHFRRVPGLLLESIP